MRRSLFVPLAGTACAALALLVGCAGNSSPPPPPVAVEAPPKPPGVTCAPVQAGDPMVGTWYAVSKQKGIAGDYQVLTVLSQDGRMHYETQLKVGRKIRPALRESGCWRVTDGIYTMQTTVSNGEDVDITDPIYINRYRVEKIDQARLTLRDLKSGGQSVTARRMPPGYQLPF